ncbi:MAG: adenylate/guanylate cyclase domain-containing protein [Spirochaetales bacterium]|nr:adenylate/guanylate cyclase domain-containing protein [Leptospiraceae bacterium]MCP5483586.1 adenylate/guanylate cyclase domain-containing protein [Spirochaetales bacterium]MCP5486440.1 adenylate/guanylate cyclase domain-containing protein [Spirochaetales bacterium]
MKPGIGRPIVFFVIVTCLASTPLVAQSAPGLPAEYLALESGDADAARLAPPEAWRAFPGESLVRAGNLSAFWLRLPVVSSARSPALLIETPGATHSVYALVRGELRPVFQSNADPFLASNFYYDLIALPPQNSGFVYIYLTVTNAKLFFFRGVASGEEIELLQGLLRQRMDRLIFGFVFVLTGLLFLLLSVLREGERQAIVAFNLFAVFLGLFSISGSEVGRSVFDGAWLWSRLSVFSLMLALISLTVFTEAVVRTAWKAALTWLWRLQLVFGLVFFVATLVSPGESDWFLLSQGILTGLSLILLMVFSIQHALHGSVGARIYCGAFVVFGLTGLHDLIGGYQNQLVWSHYLYPYGMAVFVLGMGSVLERRFANARRMLVEYSHELSDGSRRLEHVNSAYRRFVPDEFLRYLGKPSITDVRLGDNVEMDLAIVVTDIHAFTALSESMTPAQNFDFINSYLDRLGPVIRRNHGFIAKYMGDGIMALFPRKTQDAVRCAIEIQETLYEYNARRTEQGRDPVQTGIGVHTGTVRLGIIGEAERVQGDVIADAANTAARMEGLTRIYGASIVISEQSLFDLEDPNAFSYRILDRVAVKGRQEPVTVIEMLLAEMDGSAGLKMMTRPDFEKGLSAYLARDFESAKLFFQKVVAENPQDLAARMYLHRSGHYARHGAPPDWEAVIHLDRKH